MIRQLVLRWREKARKVFERPFKGLLSWPQELRSNEPRKLLPLQKTKVRFAADLRKKHQIPGFECGASLEDGMATF